MSATTVKNRATVARPTATGKATPRRERELFVRWCHDRDAAAQEELVARFSPLSRSLARRYRHTSEPFDDLYQIAQLGLVKAIDGYDPERGIPFTAYAVPTILGELRRHFRTATWAAHVPRAAQERALELRKAERILVDEHGRSPTVCDLAQFMELSEEEVLDALQTQGALVSVSLDAPRGSDAGDEESSYAELFGDEDPNYELAELGTDLGVGLRQLDPDERELLRLRFIEELTQRQIGERVGVSQMQISRMLAKCLARLRDCVEAPA
jgi:RNA polymerase sigma-B factor